MMGDNYFEQLGVKPGPRIPMHGSSKPKPLTPADHVAAGALTGLGLLVNLLVWCAFIGFCLFIAAVLFVIHPLSLLVIGVLLLLGSRCCCK